MANYYLKKYLELKEQIGGDNKSLIIHISGPSGAGKTTLGKKLKKEFNDKIVVEDIDDLRQKFIRSRYEPKEKFKIIDKDGYQLFIDNFIKKNNNKPIVFVGLNHMPWWHKHHYYNTHSMYNFFINLDDKVILKQKCLRSFKDIVNDKHAMNDLINDNEQFLKIFTREIKRNCSLKEIKKMNDVWRRDYKSQGYTFLSREEIFNKVSKILKKIMEK